MSRCLGVVTLDEGAAHGAEFERALIRCERRSLSMDLLLLEAGLGSQWSDINRQRQHEVRGIPCLSSLFDEPIQSVFGSALGP